MHLPGPLRAVVGLAATAATEAKHLPDRAIELPMLVVSSALQASLRAQQRYARFAARGDEVLNRRTPTQEPPPWATFDEPVPLDELRRAGGLPTNGAEPATGRSALEQLLGVEDPTLDPHGREPVEEILPADEPPVAPPPSGVPSVVSQIAADAAATRTDAITPAATETDTTAPAATTSGATTSAATTTDTTTPAARKPAATKKAATKKAATRKAAAKKAAKKTLKKKTGTSAAKSATTPTTSTTSATSATKAAPTGPGDPAVARAKTVNKPRHTTPSAFDNATDD